MKTAVVVIVCALTLLAVFGECATAQPWMPDACENLSWNSPPSQVFRCLMDVMSELFASWPGFEYAPEL